MGKYLHNDSCYKLFGLQSKLKHKSIDWSAALVLREEKQWIKINVYVSDRVSGIEKQTAWNSLIFFLVIYVERAIVFSSENERETISCVYALNMCSLWIASSLASRKRENINPSINRTRLHLSLSLTRSRLCCKDFFMLCKQIDESSF